MAGKDTLSSLLGASVQRTLEKRCDSKVALQRALTIEKLKVLLHHSDSLPGNRIEVPELPFDRLLLKYSDHYRRTRMLAHRLGVGLVPKMTSNFQSLAVFEPDEDRIFFSPAESEIRFWTDSPIDDARKARQFQTLKSYVTRAYHELNHAILYRLLKPKGKLTSRQAARYYAFVESLVIWRDIQLAEELGYIGKPLKEIGVLYRAVTGSPGSKTVDSETFRAAVLFHYLMVLGYSKTRAHQKLKSLGLVFRHAEAGVSANFIKKDVPRWMKTHIRLEGRRLALPKPRNSSMKVMKTFSLDFANSEKLLRNQETISDLFTWFNCVFLSQPTVI